MYQVEGLKGEGRLVKKIDTVALNKSEEVDVFCEFKFKDDYSYNIDDDVVDEMKKLVNLPQTKAKKGDTVLAPTLTKNEIEIDGVKYVLSLNKDKVENVLKNVEFIIDVEDYYRVNIKFSDESLDPVTLYIPYGGLIEIDPKTYKGFKIKDVKIGVAFVDLDKYEVDKPIDVFVEVTK